MKRSLNLMSERSRQREQVRCCLRFWSRACAAILLVLSSLGFLHWQTCRQQQQRQASVEAEYEPIRQLKLKNVCLRKQVEAMKSTERIPLALANHRPLLSLIGFATKTIAEHDGAIYLRQIEIEREPLALESTRQPMLMFALEGSARDSNAVAQLADALRQTGPFAEVELDLISASGTGEQTQQDFSIQCTSLLLPTNR